MIRALILALFLLPLGAFADDVKPKSFFPEKELAKFLYENLDLRTFPSSLRPRMTPETKHLADLSLTPTKTEEALFEIDTEDWLYTFRIEDRIDVDKDGVEDLIVVFTDFAKKGSYRSAQQLVLTRLNDKALVVAITPPNGR